MGTGERVNREEIAFIIKGLKQVRRRFIFIVQFEMFKFIDFL